MGVVRKEGVKIGGGMKRETKERRKARNKQ